MAEKPPAVPDVVDHGVLHHSTGILCYGSDKLVLEVDRGIVDCYRSFLPRSVVLNRQKYDAHISVVRKEIPPRMEFWKKHAGEQVEFEYGNMIRHGTVYFWLNAWSVRLEEIRLELGLPVDSLYVVPPPGFRKTFHISLGNIKE
jgi:hypothetical protein